MGKTSLVANGKLPRLHDFTKVNVLNFWHSPAEGVWEKPTSSVNTLKTI